MSEAVAHAEPTRAAPRDEFGSASTGKIAMWIFLLSDAFSFGGLLLGYGILRGFRDEWPNPTHYLGIDLTAAMTFLLICSSVTMVMSLAAASEKNKKQTLLYLGLTIVGGLTFLGLQAYEYTHLFLDKNMALYGLADHATAAGATLSAADLALQQTPQFASTFFIITGFHGAHVTTGVIYLAVMFYQVAKNNKHLGNINGLEIAGLFWHFVDLIWILVFTFIYLIE